MKNSYGSFRRFNFKNELVLVGVNNISSISNAAFLSVHKNFKKVHLYLFKGDTELFRYSAERVRKFVVECRGLIDKGLKVYVHFVGYDNSTLEECCKYSNVRYTVDRKHTEFNCDGVSLLIRPGSESLAVKVRDSMTFWGFNDFAESHSDRKVDIEKNFRMTVYDINTGEVIKRKTMLDDNGDLFFVDSGVLQKADPKKFIVSIIQKGLVLTFTN